MEKGILLRIYNILVVSYSIADKNILTLTNGLNRIECPYNEWTSNRRCLLSEYQMFNSPRAAPVIPAGLSGGLS